MAPSALTAAVHRCVLSGPCGGSADGIDAAARALCSRGLLLHIGLWSVCVEAPNSLQALPSRDTGVFVLLPLVKFRGNSRTCWTQAQGEGARSGDFRRRFLVNSPVPSVTADSRMAKARLAHCCVLLTSLLMPLPAGVRNLTPINIFIILKNGPEPILFVQLKVYLCSYGLWLRSICVKSLDGHQAPWVKMGYTVSGPLPSRHVLQH